MKFFGSLRLGRASTHLFALFAGQSAVDRTDPFRILLTACAFALWSGVCLGQTTLHVPADKATIQLAIDAAADGDTILVAPGTSAENLLFNGKAIAVLSTQGAASTIIDGRQIGSVLTFHNGETTNTMVSGFTIRHGSGYFGSAVDAEGASPTLVDNVFDSNDGGAIWGNSSSATIERNLFTNNPCGSQSLFAVVTFVNTSSPTIRDNVFVNNACPAIDMTLPVGNVPDVSNNTIVGNDVGIQIDARVQTNLHLYRNNLVYNNVVGINVMFGSATNYPTLEHNLVFGNTTNYQGIADQTGSNGSIAADPLLGGLSANDYHTDPGSPAIDAGLNAAVTGGDADFYAATRIRARSSGSAVVDIGAVEYDTPEPTVSLSSSAPSIALTGHVTLTWSSSGATSCVAGGAWSGSLAVSGMATVTPAVAGTLTYKVICSNSGGARAKSVALIVYPPPAITITASPATVPAGTVSTLSWNVTTATTCNKTGAWSGAAPTSGSLTIGPPDPGSYTYGLSCVGPGGSGANSTSLTVVPRPTLTLDLNPQSLPVGGTANLTWSSANTNSCQASGNWSGAEPTNGAQTLGPLPAGTYGYTLTCVGPAGGSVVLSQTLTVNPLPTVTIALVPSDLAIGSAATLTWSATTATACEASGAWTGSVPISGTQSISPSAAGTYDYGITCNGPGGSSSATAELTVSGLVTTSIAANPTTITVGDTVTLTWTSSNAASCSGVGTWSGSLALNGTQPVSPSSAGSYTYQLVCTGAGSNSSSSVTITVNAKAPTAPAGGGGGTVGMLDLLALVLFAGLGSIGHGRRAISEARGRSSCRDEASSGSASVVTVH